MMMMKMRKVMSRMGSWSVFMEPRDKIWRFLFTLGKRRVWFWLGREQKLSQFFWSYGISAIRELLKLCFDCLRSHDRWLEGWEETREAVSHGSKKSQETLTLTLNLFLSRDRHRDRECSQETLTLNLFLTRDRQRMWRGIELNLNWIAMHMHSKSKMDAWILWREIFVSYSVFFCLQKSCLIINDCINLMSLLSTEIIHDHVLLFSDDDDDDDDDSYVPFVHSLRHTYHSCIRTIRVWPTP